MEPVQRLLYVSPVVPSHTGNGLAMRAGRMIDLLARRHAVWLLVVPLHGHIDLDVPSRIASRCRAVATFDTDALPRDPFHAALSIDWTSRDGVPPSWPFPDTPFDIVHAYRLTALPVARRYAQIASRGRSLHVDLDEAESESRLELAGLFRQDGKEMAARFAELEAARCSVLERAVVERADAVYVSSSAERDALAHTGLREKIRVVPNVIDVSVECQPPPRRRPGDPFRLLFVGTLAFRANEVAVEHFCCDVLPLLRARSDRPVEFVIVGAGTSPRVTALAAADDDVRLVGAVADVAPYYAECDAVIVPLRSGRGARLKVLEAMAHGRAVVSTSTGLTGIDAEPDRSVLVGDGAEQFAEQCCRLIADPTLGARLAIEAHALVSSAHTIDAAAAALYA